MVPVQDGETAALEPIHVRGVELRAVLHSLRERCASEVAELRQAYVRSAELAKYNVALRERCQETRERTRRLA
jgi:hypothetical protein